MSAIAKLLGAYSVVVVGDNRYGGGFAAFIATEETAGKLQNWLTCGDDDYAAIAYGVLGSEWYPFATGDSPVEAVSNLEKVCERINEINFGGETSDYILNTVIEAMWTVDGRDVRPEFDGRRTFAYRYAGAVRNKTFLALIDSCAKENRAAKEKKV